MQGGRDQCGRKKAGHPDPSSPGQGACPGKRITFSHTVKDHPDIKAPLRSTCQRFKLTPSCGIGFKDIGRKINRPLSLVDRLQHFRVRLFAVVKHDDTVAPQEGSPRHRFGDTRQSHRFCGDTDADLWAFVSRCRTLIPDTETKGFSRTQFFCPGADTVNAEEKIEQWSENWKGQADADPSESGFRIALIEQGVARRKRRDHQVERYCNPRKQVQRLSSVSRVLNYPLGSGGRKPTSGTAILFSLPPRR